MKRLISLFLAIGFIVFLGMLNQGCSSTPTTPATPTATATPNYKRVFVTSGTFTGNLGGLAGADATCLIYATAANLGGTWVAYVSDTYTTAYSKIADVGPWYLVDRSTKVFNNKSNILTTPLTYINRTESGLVGSSFNVWTGTSSTGAATSYNCNNWTVGTGYSYNGTYGYSSSQSQWSQYSYDYCSYSYHLYCFEQ